MTRDELIKQNEELTERVAAFEAQLAAQATQADAAQRQLCEALDTVRAELDEARTQAADCGTLLTETRAEIEDLQGMVETLAAERDALQAAIANPATADLSLVPAATATVSISDAEANELDEAARKATEDARPKTVREQYEAMPFGAERQAFLRKNRAAILSDIEEQ